MMPNNQQIGSRLCVYRLRLAMLASCSTMKTTCSALFALSILRPPLLGRLHFPGHPPRPLTTSRRIWQSKRDAQTLGMRGSKGRGLTTEVPNSLSPTMMLQQHRLCDRDRSRTPHILLHSRTSDLSHSSLARPLVVHTRRIARLLLETVHLAFRNAAEHGCMHAFIRPCDTHTIH